MDRQGYFSRFGICGVKHVLQGWCKTVSGILGGPGLNLRRRDTKTHPLLPARDTMIPSSSADNLSALTWRSHTTASVPPKGHLGEMSNPRSTPDPPRLIPMRFSANLPVQAKSRAQKRWQKTDGEGLIKQKNAT